MVSVDVDLDEGNISSISYEEQIPEHSEIEAVNVSENESYEEPLIRKIEQTPICVRTSSIEIDVQDSSSEEIQVVYEKSKNSEPQVGQNIEKVKFYLTQIQ